MKRGVVFLCLFLTALSLFYNGFYPRKADAGYERYGKNPSFEAPETHKKVRFFLLPIIFYSKETSLAGGAAMVLLVQPAPRERPSSVNLAAFYSLNRQFSFGLTPVIFWKQGEYRLSGSIAYRLWPTTFYGVGNDTDRSDREHYTSRTFSSRVSFQKRLFSNLYAGPRYQYIYTNITDVEEGKLLAGGAIRGSEGGGISGVGIIAAWDTRNSLDYPERGGYHQFSSSVYGSYLGSDYTFSSFFADLRYYQPLFSSHVLAFRGVAGIMTGDPPFQMLNPLGAYLRGYDKNRFMDKHFAVFLIEYRLPLFWRLGLAGFAGFGKTAGTYRDISFRELKPSGGIGIRFALVPEKKINLRIDLGVGVDEVCIDLGVREAF